MGQRYRCTDRTSASKATYRPIEPCTCTKVTDLAKTRDAVKNAPSGPAKIAAINELNRLFWASQS
jgi:hypothetical protein